MAVANTSRFGRFLSTHRAAKRMSRWLSVEQLECRNQPAVASIHPLLTPNDTYFGNEYGLKKISAPAAWDITTGSTGVVVASIDSGIDYKHPDLYRNIWINQGEIPQDVKDLKASLGGSGPVSFYDLNARSGSSWVYGSYLSDVNGNTYIDGGDLLSLWSDGTDADGNGYTDDLVGWNFTNNSNNPFDDNGHGTHTAGTIGAMGNNGRGVAGVAWQVQMMALKFITADGGGEVDWAADAIRYAADNGAAVSNNSWAYYEGTVGDEIYSAIVHARDQGHLIVAAAGNNGFNNDTSYWRSYPASFNLDNIISVTATDSKDHKPYWANYGKTSVDLGAPGVSVLSTLPNGGYGYGSGTSMASPHVAGGAALILAEYPDLSYTEVRAALLQGVDVVRSMSGTATGGRLNVDKALDKAAALAAGTVVAASADTGDTTTTDDGSQSPGSKGNRTRSLDPASAARESARLLSASGTGSAVTDDILSVVNSRAGTLVLAPAPIAPAPVTALPSTFLIGNGTRSAPLTPTYLVSARALTLEEDEQASDPVRPAGLNPEAVPPEVRFDFIHEFLDRIFTVPRWLQQTSALDLAPDIAVDAEETALVTPLTADGVEFLGESAYDFLDRELALALVLTGLACTPLLPRQEREQAQRLAVGASLN